MEADELKAHIKAHFPTLTEFAKAFIEMSEIGYNLKTMVENVSRHQTGRQNITEGWAAAYRLFFYILERILAEWCAWKIGDADWWREMKYFYDELERNKAEQENQTT